VQNPNGHSQIRVPRVVKPRADLKRVDDELRRVGFAPLPAMSLRANVNACRYLRSTSITARA
jgi:hypothetical protein